MIEIFAEISTNCHRANPRRGPASFNDGTGRTPVAVSSGESGVHSPIQRSYAGLAQGPRDPV